MTTAQPARHRRGDIRSDGLFFWAYHKKYPGGELWVSSEELQLRRSRITAKNRAYAAANPEKVKALGRAWAQRFPEKVLARRRRYVAANRRELNEKARREYAENPEFERADARRKYGKAPERAWEAHIRARYGMSKERYERLLWEQGYACAICGRPEADLTVRMAIDHDHDTGKVRGILCHMCNTAIGKFKDSPELLEKAAAYIRAAQ